MSHANTQPFAFKQQEPASGATHGSVATRDPKTSGVSERAEWDGVHEVLVLDPPSPRTLSAIEAAGARAIEPEALSFDHPPLCALISGRGAAQRLSAFRDDPRTFAVPVIARVRHPAESSFRAAFVAGADDVLVADDFGGITRRVASLSETARSHDLPPRGRVIIVDSDATRRRNFGRTLRRAGMTVEFASSLDEASAAQPPDVVVAHHALGTDDVRHTVRKHFGDLALPVVLIVEPLPVAEGGCGVDLGGAVPANAPPDHLLFVVNELLCPGLAEQRSSARLLFSTLCSFRQPGDLTPNYGVTYNISRDGVFVRTLDPPPIGAPIWLELRPPHAIGVVHLRGNVVWRSFMGGTTPAGFAVRLLSHACPPADLATYRGQYRQLLTDHRGHSDSEIPQPSYRPGQPSGVGEAQLLVVDDERMVRDAIARLFRDTEIEVTLAHDGAHAVELLRHKHFDAVITDVHMPNLSGIELLKAIHIDDAEIPVIITTGEPTTESAIQALDNGAVRYLLKPIDGGELVKAVSNAIGMRRLAVFHRQAALVASRTPAVDEIADLDGAFDRAIAGLFAHYQPIISLPDRRVVAYEALARTNETSFPHPGALFDAAERLDRVASVGRRMRVAAPIPFKGRSEQLFINLHPSDLMDESLFDPKSPLAMMASQVVLEITERASLSSVGDLRDRITRLRNIGYRIAVDDLGAGYAGLSAFVALSPDFVKLDMSLVRDVHRSTTQQRLIHSLLAVCKDLDIRVVSEGVETPEELATLRDLGCELFQGFLFARPGLGLTLEPNWG